MKRIYLKFLILVLAFYGAAPVAVSAQQNSLQQPAPSAAATSPLTLPVRKDSLKFMAVGDTGRGNREQNELAAVMFEYHKMFPFEFVILTGDNIYYQESAEDLKTKFENVYRPLLDGGVKFYASLGNHDESNQRFYAPFNMGGEEYYRLAKGDVAFYALNSTYMDKRQLAWIEQQLAKETAKWKIAFFHHPPYSSGKRHGSEKEIRDVLEPLFVKYGVDVVFTGHEHFYERIKPQKGIQYFVTGAGGEVRKNNVKKNSLLTAKAFDTDLSFMLIEIAGEEMHYQVISRARQTVDSGVVALTNNDSQTKTAAAAATVK
jgi:predicted MPP superfamily phosphohydrolase